MQFFNFTGIITTLESNDKAKAASNLARLRFQGGFLRFREGCYD